MKTYFLVLLFFTQSSFATMADEIEMARLEFRASMHQLSLELSEGGIAISETAAKSEVDPALWLRFGGNPLLQSTIVLHSLASSSEVAPEATEIANAYLKKHKSNVQWNDIANTELYGPEWLFRPEYALLEICHSSVRVKQTDANYGVSGDLSSYDGFSYDVLWRDGDERFVLVLQARPNRAANLAYTVSQTRSLRTYAGPKLARLDLDYLTYIANLDTQTVELKAKSDAQYESLDNEKHQVEFKNAAGQPAYNKQYEYRPDETMHASIQTFASSNLDYVEGFKLLDSRFECEDRPARWVDDAPIDDFVKAKIGIFSAVFHETEGKRREWLKCLSTNASEDCKKLLAQYKSASDQRENTWSKLFVSNLPAKYVLKSTSVVDYTAANKPDVVIPAVQKSAPTQENKVAQPTANPPFLIPDRTCEFIRRSGGVIAYCDSNLTCRYEESKRGTTAKCSNGMVCKQIPQSSVTCKN